VLEANRREASGEEEKQTTGVGGEKGASADLELEVAARAELRFAVGVS
jgi:hypothetical protein